jgi:hypothetical protein
MRIRDDIWRDGKNVPKAVGASSRKPVKPSRKTIFGGTVQTSRKTLKIRDDISRDGKNVPNAVFVNVRDVFVGFRDVIYRPEFPMFGTISYSW